MSFDLRKYAAQTNFRLGVGAFLVLFFIGLGLIWAIYGIGAALMGLLCLLGMLIPVGLIYLVFYGLGWLVEKSDKDR